MALLVSQTRVEAEIHSPSKSSPGPSSVRSSRSSSFRCSDDRQELYETALAASQAAYAPYSKFLVGAAALLRDGRVVTGVNVENASYPVGICAERCAIGRAVVDGAKPGDFEAIGSRRHRAARAVSGCTSSGSTGSPSCTKESSSSAGRTSSCRTPSSCEKRLRRGGGPPQRRQVDARQCARGREGRDRLRQATDHKTSDRRCRER